MSANVANEPSFRESVDLMFNRAVALMDLPPGLEDKIRVCNSTYVVRFGLKLRGSIHLVARKVGFALIHANMTKTSLSGSPDVLPMNWPSAI